jgi:predicted CoA-binding protein
MTVRREDASSFLDLPRLAVVGASADERKFGNTIYRALRDAGRTVVPVNTGEETVAGDPCYPSVKDVPGGIDGAIVMTPAASAAGVVRDCIDAGIRNVWLFKGIGGPGATSDEARQLCHDAGISTIDGACPLMFLEPVRGAHRFHRSIRHLRGAVA